MTLVQGLRKNRASTHPHHEDADLRGRTYAIPFDQVWEAVVYLAGGGLSRWLVLRADDGPGIVQAEVRPILWGENSDVLIRVKLDRNAQTRVDITSSSRGTRGDLGASRRRVLRFIQALDQRLSATERQILTPAARASLA